MTTITTVIDKTYEHIINSLSNEDLHKLLMFNVPLRISSIALVGTPLELIPKIKTALNPSWAAVKDVISTEKEFLDDSAIFFSKKNVVEIAHTLRESGVIAFTDFTVTEEFVNNEKKENTAKAETFLKELENLND